eukprot:TRINITY_DN7275_c0_g1_i1.p1 TRINITY_DN7275_c0_g1~~TRINITY_DN7275_c0_g1_i1.p1  ORF type:complete len:544 (-),score=75.37 TRINITY_DN7275_c0_g1_i1:63-1460(-)
MYRTGDMGRRLENGCIQYLQRMDNEIKILGIRVNTLEIEHAINLHPSVTVSLILYENRFVTAYVVLREGTQKEQFIKSIKNHLNHKLPRGLIPQRFVVLDKLPLNSNMKLDRKVLISLTPPNRSATKQRILPTTKTEKALAVMFEELLGIKDVGIEEDFFELGGHSLTALQLVSRIKSSLFASIPVARIFENSNIKSLAQLVLHEDAKAASSTAIPLKQGTSLPLFCVHPAGGNTIVYTQFVKEFPADQTIYGLDYAFSDADVYESLEDMASAYIESIMQVQRQGPYLLCGYSSGGVVAFEIAQQLTQRGHKVGIVALLDSELKMQENMDDIDIMLLLIVHFRKEMDTSNIREELKNLKNSKLQYGRIASIIGVNKMKSRDVETFCRLFKYHIKLLVEYCPKHSFLTGLRLYRGKDGNSVVSDWQHYVKDLTVKEYDGDHRSMLTLPNASLIAQDIVHFLENLQV